MGNPEFVPLEAFADGIDARDCCDCFDSLSCYRMLKCQLITIDNGAIAVREDSSK